MTPALGILFPAASLLACQWLLACAGALAVAGLLWLMLTGAAQLWPALRTQRGVWLAAQVLIGLAAVLPFLPPGARIGHAPQITLPAAMPAIDAEPHTTPVAADFVAGGQSAAANADADGVAAPQAVVRPKSTMQVLPVLAALWLLCYLAGLARAGTVLLRARRLWRRLLAASHVLSPAELQTHGAFSPAQLREIAAHGLTVARIDAAVSPMLIGVRRPLLLLPARLDLLSREQQQMIVAHELHHWRVRDPLYLAIASALQTIFWFIPPLRWMAKQMEWALELRCDQHVLAGRPQQQRKQYAAALLQQWTTMMPAAAAAFGGATIAARLRHMQQTGLPALSATAAWLTAAAMAAVLAVSALVQPALAFSVPTERSVVGAAAGAADAAAVWRAPLEHVRVTSFYGVMRSVLPTPHKGVDFAAARGTPVHAAAAGTVIAAGPITENRGRYGNVVLIDHGAQQSLYAHLDTVNVKPGQHVQAGQLIAASGKTGFTTGPHLHLEVRQDGHDIDPATLLTDLDAHATARALKVRHQQLPSKG